MQLLHHLHLEQQDFLHLLEYHFRLTSENQLLLSIFFLQNEEKHPGFTIVPTRLFINEKGLAKLVIALAKGKKQYDKRQSLKEKDDKREMDRMFKR